MRIYEINIICPEHYRDLLIYELNSFNGASFWETDDGINVYFQEQEFQRNKVSRLLNGYHNLDSGIAYNISVLPDINWNKEWESNYSPVVINDKYLIRAPFHPDDEDMTTIVINPQMAFGTGHHQTTEMMIQLADSLEMKGKKVLDFGTGTGILALVAENKGAAEILAIDNDEQAVKSAATNLLLNKTERISLLTASIEDIDESDFDLIMANITRNILLENSIIIVKKIKIFGHLIISGFLREDVDFIESEFTKKGMKVMNKLYKDKWASCLFFKEEEA